ncbi:MAG: family 20 glycosylhydrolase [Planctomycetota bacterium]
MDQKAFPHLLPTPSHIEPTGGSLDPGRLSAGYWLEQETGLDLEFAYGRPLGPPATAADAALVLRLDAELPGPEAWRAEITQDRITITGASPRAWLHGLRAVGQWIAPAGPVPCVRLAAAPALARRGLMLDISRDRVPQQRALLEWIDRVARVGGNHLELYMEHTFAYQGHAEVHQDSSPLTPEEIRELVAHARRRGVDLVPNQNTFGHMHRWLRLPKYRHLAEQPEGMWHAFEHRREPFSLCPTDPGSLELIEDLLGQLLPLFEGPWFQGGLDETLDVGQGRSRERTQRDGIGKVYGRYAAAVAELAARHGKRLLYWADIAVQHPEALDWLPRDAMAVLWGYEQGHPFPDQASLLRERGVPFLVAPGASTWQSLSGRWHNAAANLEEALSCALEYGAQGLILTEWGDYGHWQDPDLCLPAVARALAAAWNPTAPRADAEAIEAAFPGCGAAVSIALQSAGSTLEDGSRNGLGPFFALRYPPHGPNAEESLAKRAPTCSAAGLKRYRAALQAALSAGGPVPGGLQFTQAAGDWAARVAEDRLAGRAVPPPLASELPALCEQFAGLWRSKSRAGGLADSLEKWTHALHPTEAAGLNFP